MQYKMGKSSVVDDFIGLLNPYEGPLKRYIFSQLINKEATLDIYQETLYSAYASFSKLRNKNSFRFWIFRIAQNQIKMYFRRQKHVESSYDALHDSIPNHEIFIDDLDIEETLLLNLDKTTIANWINELPFRDRQFVVYYYLEDRSYNEIAKLLKTKPESLRVVNQRIKAKLRKRAEADE